MNSHLVEIVEEEDTVARSSQHCTPMKGQIPQKKRAVQINFDFFKKNPLKPDRQSQQSSDEDQSESQLELIELESSQKQQDQKQDLDNFLPNDRINRILQKANSNSFQVQWKKRHDKTTPLRIVLTQSEIIQQKGILKLLNFYQENVLVQGSKYLFNINIDLSKAKII